MKALNAAALARAEAIWNAGQVHESGKVPATPVTPYLVLSVTAPGDTNPRGGGRSGSQSGWIVAQAVGKSVGEVSYAVEKADAALLSQRLTVTGVSTTPATRGEPSPVIRDPDAGGLLTCTLLYRFTTTPAKGG